MKTKDEKPQREYKAANGMILKTKNAKQSWNGRSAQDPQVLHVTRRGQYWIEMFDHVELIAVAKHVDTRDAMQWLRDNGHYKGTVKTEEGKRGAK